MKPWGARVRPRFLGLVLLLLVAGCRQTPPVRPLPIENEVVSAEPVLVVPGSRWQAEGREGRWSFQNRGALVCWIGEAASRPLTVRLRPSRDTAEHHFRFEWDGEELTEPAVRRREVRPKKAGGRTVTVLEVELPPARLTPGRHELKLLRDYQRDAREHRSRVKNVFSNVSFRYGSHRRALERDGLGQYQLLAHFLQYGVVGTSRQRRGGVLFAGPARHVLEATRGASGTLVLEPENLSGSPAVFRAGGESLGLEPGGRGRLAVELEGGGPGLELAVEGDPRGYFLWGVPRLAGAALSGERPPIVLVTLDTTRRDALGPYNGLADLTPTLDELARQATVYDRAYSTAPWTLPSHASIFTGLYPSKHGAGVTKRGLGDLPTLARLLAREGYIAAGFSSGDLSASRFGLAQGFHLYRDPDQFETPGGRLAGYLDELLDEYGDHTLFLFVNYFDPHALYQAPAEWNEKLNVPALEEKVRGQPAWAQLATGEMTGWRRFVEGEVEPTPEGLEYLRAAYLAEVAYTDHLLGRLFDKLREKGIYDRALIVVTADHGELLGEGGYFSHGARLDPELVEIPLLVKWPGQTEGRRSARLVSQVDLFPTVLRAAGVAPPPSDGRLLVRGSDDGSEPHPYVFLEEHESMVHPLPRGMKLAAQLFGVQRTSFRQLIWNDEQSCARRDGDGWRSEDCTTDPENVLEAIRAQLGLAEIAKGEEAVVLDEVRESLQALGYM